MAKDGKLIDVSLTSSPIRDSSGKVIGASKIAKNISLQKETARLIHENEERFRMAVEMTSLGTWEYDPRGKTLLCSRKAGKYAEYRKPLTQPLLFFSTTYMQRIKIIFWNR